jgi:hypothetical protein
MMLAGLLDRGLRNLKDRHRGETCYIFGDGPSLKWFDLTKFADHPAICCGMLPFHREFANLDVRYCLLLEPWAFTPDFIRTPLGRLGDCIDILNAYRKVIEGNRGRIFLVHLTNRLSLRGENIRYAFRGLPGMSGPTAVRLRSFPLFAGSFHGSLSLAWYLGFARVYLAGFDGWTVDPARAGHWYELGQGPVFQPTNYARDFLETLQRDMEINVITVDSSGSKNLNAVSYESHTNSAAIFRENHELVPLNYLQALAAYPAYRIFP